MEILIVEDSLEIQRLYQRIFRGDHVIITANARQAIRHLRKEVPDLMILDIQLPEVSGVDVLKYIRLRMKLSKLKILVVTGTAFTSKYDYAQYADATLDKPFGRTELMDKVQLLTESSNQTEPGH